MPRFCGFCGMQNDDIALTCSKCGTPFQQTQSDSFAQPQQPVQAKEPVNDYPSYYNQQPQAPAKREKKKINIDFKKIIDDVIDRAAKIVAGVKKGDKKSIITVGGAAAAVLAVVVLLVSIFSVGGEEKAAKKILKAIDKENAQSIVKLVPKFCLGESSFGFTKNEADWAEDFSDRIDYFRDDISEKLNSDSFSMKWEIIDIDFFGDKMLEELGTGLKLYDEFKENKLKKGALVVVETESKKGGEKFYSELEIYLYKYGANWYLYTWSVKDSVEN